MDEDELLYREMNEDDPWYMGDRDEDYDDDEEYDGEEEETFRRNAVLLFWRPKRSQFSSDDYAKTRDQYGKRFTLNAWPVTWPGNVAAGDKYYMVRLETERKGVVWHGTVASDPYKVKSKSGKSTRWCVDLNVEDAIKPDARPLVTLEEMRALNVDEHWERLNSGQMLGADVEERFDELIWQNQYKESHPYKGYTSKEAYEENVKKQRRKEDQVGCFLFCMLIFLAAIAMIWILT